jgi:2-(1,2-epoxy-1,2-dihydrophenyl)acetyl-CoA isomerase
MEEELLFEQRDHVAILTLNRPQALNALTMGMLDGLQREWARLGEDPNVRVVVITGAGRGFCSGIDLRQTDFSGPRQMPNIDYSQQWIARLRALGKPVLGAINGVAADGGLGLALGCDIRIASEAARFAAIFANIGMPVLDGVGSLLPQTVGLAKALELIYTAEIIDAREAERIGLVSYVVPADSLMDRTLELAERIAAGPPVALAMSKHVVYNGLGRSYVDSLVYQNLGIALNATFGSHDIAEGGKAFRERRKPEFRGLEGGA